MWFLLCVIDSIFSMHLIWRSRRWFLFIFFVATAATVAYWEINYLLKSCQPFVPLYRFVLQFVFEIFVWQFLFKKKKQIEIHQEANEKDYFEIEKIGFGWW